MGGWIGVDLDGCLAHYSGWPVDGTIGDPVPAMLARVRKWLAEGREVRIFTARVGTGGGFSVESGRHDDGDFAGEQRGLIDAWCLRHLGQVLPITATKDFAMIELYDDRVVSVEMNTGRILTEGRADG